MPALCTSKNVRSRNHQFLFVGFALPAVVGFSLPSSTPPRMEPVGNLPTEPITAVGPRLGTRCRACAFRQRRCMRFATSGGSHNAAPNGTFAGDRGRTGVRCRTTGHDRSAGYGTASAHQYRFDKRAPAGYRHCHRRYRTGAPLIRRQRSCHGSARQSHRTARRQAAVDRQRPVRRPPLFTAARLLPVLAIPT